MEQGRGLEQFMIANRKRTQHGRGKGVFPHQFSQEGEIRMSRSVLSPEVTTEERKLILESISHGLSAEEIAESCRRKRGYPNRAMADYRQIVGEVWQENFA
jgi:hypothetical protein